MPLEIVLNDITKMEVDAIVNAANTALRMGGDVCGAIFQAAGARELQQEWDSLGGRCETGQAVITRRYALPARYIIHTVGPVWRGGGHGEAELLRSCYLNSLQLAQDYQCESIAFPLISSGIYGYPRAEALKIAITAIGDFLSQTDMDVYLVMFDKTAFALSEGLTVAVRSYIDEYYVKAHTSPRRRLIDVDQVLCEEMPYAPAPMPKAASKLEEVVGRLDEPFSQTLFRLIDAKGKTDVEVYKRANLDRKLFSKIRSNHGYMPSKKTAVALAVALELNLDETKDLLERAGYTLSHSQKFDVIIEYFITNGNYNIHEINETLFYFDQPLLGG